MRRYLSGREPRRSRGRRHNTTTASVQCVHSSREKEAVVCARETEMATPATEAAAAAATPVAPAEGTVIAIHSLDAWSTQIEQANSAKKLVPFSCLLPLGIKPDLL